MPNLARVYYKRGSAYDLKGDFDHALADYGKTIEFDPNNADANNADAYNGRCWLRATHNVDLADALADCDASLKLSPGDANVLGSRGFVYLRLGRLEEAIADFDRALKTEPLRPDELYARGLAKRKKGDRAGGDADVAAAKLIKADIDAVYAKYGAI